MNGLHWFTIKKWHAKSSEIPNFAITISPAPSHQPPPVVCCASPAKPPASRGARQATEASCAPCAWARWQRCLAERGEVKPWWNPTFHRKILWKVGKYMGNTMINIYFMKIKSWSKQEKYGHLRNACLVGVDLGVKNSRNHGWAELKNRTCLMV